MKIIADTEKSGGYQWENVAVKEGERDFVVVQSLSCVWHFEISCTVAGQSTLSSNISQCLFKFMSS